MNRSAYPLFLALLSMVGTSAQAQTCKTGVRSHSSPPNIMHNARIHHVYWGDYWNAATLQRSAIDTTWNDLGNDANFWGRLAEYGVGLGSFYDSKIFNPSIVQGSGIYVAESDIRAELASEFESGQLANFWDNNDLYVIYLPAGVSSAYDGDAPALAHHNSWTDSAGHLIRYAVIEFASTDYQTLYASHEIIEAATDPDPEGQSAYWTDNGGWEVGDLCEYDQYRQDGHLIQGSWSEDACGCLHAPLPPPADPCLKLPPAQRLCCHKPSLPVCRGDG